MDPAGASQPPKATAYKQKGVGVDSNPEELRAAQQKSSGKSVETRFSANDALDADKAQPTPVAWGTRGALVGEEAHGGTEEEYGRHQELDGQQMCASGEGAVADVVRRKPGATGSQPDLASDLDRYVYW